jgi:hypothetical protein
MIKHSHELNSALSTTQVDEKTVATDASYTTSRDLTSILGPLSQDNRGKSRSLPVNVGKARNTV